MLLCYEGVERADLVAETAEVIVVGTVDPEKICCLLHEVTQKHVKIETQATMSEGGAVASQQAKNRVSQVPLFWTKKSNFHRKYHDKSYYIYNDAVEKYIAGSCKSAEHCLGPV
jgi:hypothetical protein